MKICASSFQCCLSSESLTLHQENPNSWCGIMLMWARVTGLGESWQSSAIWAAEQQPRAARSCHALPASAAPATPTNFGAFPNLMQWRISMTLKPEIPQFALGWDWECQLFCPPLPKLSHSLLYPVCHSQFPSLIVPGSARLHQTSRNFSTAKKLSSSFQKEQTKYTGKSSVPNKQPGNVKMNGAGSWKWEEPDYLEGQAGHRVLCNLLDHSF